MTKRELLLSYSPKMDIFRTPDGCWIGVIPVNDMYELFGVNEDEKVVQLAGNTYKLYDAVKTTYLYSWNAAADKYHFLGSGKDLSPFTNAALLQLSEKMDDVCFFIWAGDFLQEMTCGRLVVCNEKEIIIGHLRWEANRLDAAEIWPVSRRVGKKRSLLYRLKKRLFF